MGPEPRKPNDISLYESLGIEFYEALFLIFLRGYNFYDAIGKALFALIFFQLLIIIKAKKSPKFP